MKFSVETLKLLKNFTGISDVIFLCNKEGVVVLSPLGSFLGCAETEEDLDQGECVFYDWSKFLSTIQAFGNENAELEFENNYVLIKNATGGKIKYYYTDPRVLAKEYKKPKEFALYNVEFEHDASIELTENVLNELKKSSNIMGLNRLTISVKESEAIISLSEKEGITNSVHEQEVEEFTGEAEISIDFSSLNVIPGDYEILIKNDKVMKLVNKNLPVFYVVGKTKG